MRMEIQNYQIKNNDKNQNFNLNENNQDDLECSNQINRKTL